MGKRRLRSYQKNVMLDYCLRVDNPALFVEMRLGKSLVTIRRCASYPPGPRLVAAPNSALRGWRKDLSLDRVPYVDLATGAKRRGELIAGLDLNKTQFVLTNKESFQAIPYLVDVPWVAVILDESTFIKNPRARVTRFYVDKFTHVPHRWILSGRPAPEGAHEYFEQLRFIGVDPLNGRWSPGAAGFYEFRAKHMTQLPFGGWVMKTGAKRALEAQIAQHTLILRRQDVGLADQKIYETRECYLSKANYDRYLKAEKDFLLDTPDGRELDSKWVVAKYQWLRQLAGGHVEGQLVDSTKIDEIISLLKGELSGEHVVVMCNYNCEVESLYQTLKQVKLGKGSFVASITGATTPRMRDIQISEWDRAKATSILICQQAVAQMGMDLASADTMIYYSRPGSGLANSQTEDRIVSVDKAKAGRPLLYIDLVTRDTVDEEMILSVNSKEYEQDLSLEHIAQLIRRRHLKKGKQCA